MDYRTLTDKELRQRIASETYAPRDLLNEAAKRFYQNEMEVNKEIEKLKELLDVTKRDLERTREDLYEAEHQLMNSK